MFGLLRSAGARPDPDRSTATGRRHLQGSCRDQHGHRHGRYRARGRGHGRTASRRELERVGCPSVHVRTAKGQPGGAAAGTGARKPILLLAHLDVVEARREDWSVDPFKLIEKDGYFYGRGTADDKFMAAAFVANLIRYMQEGYKPDRDIIVA